MSEIETSSSQNETLTQEFLIADGLADIFAGTDTTSTSLILTIREILLNTAIYDRLHEELKTVLPTIETPPDLVKLESLPFFSACVKVRVSNPLLLLCVCKRADFSNEFSYRRAFDTVLQSALDFHVLSLPLVGPTGDISCQAGH
jgi:cytochrome P450